LKNPEVIEMNCQEARENMSAFHDGELPPEQEGLMSEHINSCEACAEELAGFNSLSMMTKELRRPEPPSEMWSDIEQALDSGESIQRAERAQRPNRRLATLLVVAATVLVAIGVSWIVYQKWHAHGSHDELAVNMAHYVEVFRKNPKEAQQYLLATYDNESAGVNEATKQLGYRPAVADSLPERYAVDAMYVLDMPCCKCVQCLCKRDDGKLLAIFEHDEDQPMWFGDRPAISARCGDAECQVVQMNGQLAFTLKRGAHHITVVGAESLVEVQKLVDAFGQNGPSTAVDSS
jgi:anti-sigma factor RsiW